MRNVGFNVRLAKIVCRSMVVGHPSVRYRRMSLQRQGSHFMTTHLMVNCSDGTACTGTEAGTVAVARVYAGLEGTKEKRGARLQVNPLKCSYKNNTRCADYYLSAVHAHRPEQLRCSRISRAIVCHPIW